MNNSAKDPSMDEILDQIQKLLTEKENQVKPFHTEIDKNQPSSNSFESRIQQIAQEFDADDKIEEELHEERHLEKKEIPIQVQQSTPFVSSEKKPPLLQEMEERATPSFFQPLKKESDVFVLTKEMILSQNIKNPSLQTISKHIAKELNILHLQEKIEKILTPYWKDKK